MEENSPEGGSVQRATLTILKFKGGKLTFEVLTDLGRQFRMTVDNDDPDLRDAILKFAGLHDEQFPTTGAMA